jgi:hypothetical protein
MGRDTGEGTPEEKRPFAAHVSTGYNLIRYESCHGAIIVPGSNLKASRAILVPDQDTERYRMVC